MAKDRFGNVVCGKCGCQKDFTPFDWCVPCMNDTNKDTTKTLKDK